MKGNCMDVEQVDYDLQYIGHDPETRALLAQTISRMPEEVVEWLLEHCSFLSVGGDQARGFVWPAKAVLRRDMENDTPPEWDAGGKMVGGKHAYTAEDAWLVVVADNLPEAEAHGIVAHECAHAYLRHDLQSLSGTREEGARVEAQAANLAREWGFTGAATDADLSAAPYLSGSRVAQD